MVLVIALLIMALMSLIGTTAFNTSNIDIQISTNTRLNRQAFYFADGGVEMSPKFVRRMVDEGAAPTVANVTLDGGLFSEIMGYTTDGGDQVYPTSVGPDIQMTMGNQTVRVDIDRTGQGFMGGSGAEFGSGSEGAGAGTTGGVLIYYLFDALSSGPNNAQSRIDVFYRYVVGTAGGK